MKRLLNALTAALAIGAAAAGQAMRPTSTEP